MTIYFPPLTQDMAAHSLLVTDCIRKEMQQAGGPISFARFMELALYAPGLGYYSAGSSKIGRGGDFITAPEISPLFAKCLARQFKDILSDQPSFNILEIGAGTGSCTKDVLLELEQEECLPPHYFILETSADLRGRQQTLLKEICPLFYSRIVWLDQLPESFHGIIFANEVVDALPVHCFRVGEHSIQERSVTFKNDQFQWELSDPLHPALTEKVTAIVNEYNLPVGYESEINLFMPDWLQSLSNLLQIGVMLFFDYGYGRREYYHRDRNKGTLRCFYQHRCHDNPFLFVGLQDITASVDFTSVATTAVQNDLQLLGFTSQTSFLWSSGIADFAHASSNAMEQYQQSQAMKLLMLPSEMGSLVKVCALGKNWNKPLRGFSRFDQRKVL